MINKFDKQLNKSILCVDARINDQQLEEAHQGVVYERHYALNWLVIYMDQDWDDVSCDT